eukprot:7312460-Pyramimonas_sp.AAC.1
MARRGGFMAGRVGFMAGWGGFMAGWGVDSWPHRVDSWPGGVVWSSEDTPKWPQHRLQTANQGVPYVKGVHGWPHRTGYQRQRCSRFPEAFTLVRLHARSGKTRTDPYWARLPHRCTSVSGVDSTTGGVDSTTGG